MKIGYVFQVTPIKRFSAPELQNAIFHYLHARLSLKVPASYFKLIHHNK